MGEPKELLKVQPVEELMVKPKGLELAKALEAVKQQELKGLMG